jgi:lysozyme
MGAKGRNDRGIYDDAIFVVGPETFAAFNANTDPSRHRPGIASLISGVHPYKLGNHGISKPGGGYPAFRPNTKGEALPVMRDGMDGIKQGIAINIHRGGYKGTSSLGCQTIPPAQWDAFYALTRSEMKKANQKGFSYILCDGPIV